MSSISVIIQEAAMSCCHCFSLHSPTAELHNHCICG
uniref:Uncharacterized protein n=1 Tax=Anguilla anguilla TaxID=7936 RepID=A0A0E9TI79_ANGAN